MHMADALVSPAVGGVMTAVSAGAAIYSVVKIKKDDFEDKKIPVMGVMGAFIFAAQMINFTIPGTGSSGHIGGGILLAAMLGEFPAFLTITAVLIIQALFFADGGLLALGCNIFNMGFLTCFVAYPLLFKPIIKHKLNTKTISLASMLAVIVGLQLGSFGVVTETLASHIVALPFAVFLSLMQPIHLVIGIAEGFVTAAVLCFIYNIRPELITATNPKNAKPYKLVLVSLIILTLLTAGVLSLFASGKPDGLEWSVANVAGTNQIKPNGVLYSISQFIQNSTSIMPDYSFKNNQNGTSIAGIAGGAAVFILIVLIVYIIRHNKRKPYNL